MIWYKANNDNDIVVSTRIRLARNVEKYPFPKSLSNEGKKEALKELENAVKNSNSTLSTDLQLFEMCNLNEKEKKQLSEKHLISPEMADKDIGAVFISKDENLSLMLMEEDHIRIQVIMAGNEIDKAYQFANKVDDVLEENLDYAFSERFGYLTACPTNTGTGLRASIMMHLPALTLTGNINKIISSVSALGLTVRGLYGEGSKAYGNLYQISNQITLGITETDIMVKLKNIVSQIEKHEKEARDMIKNNESVCDKIWRSYGVLKFARRISSQEAKALLSDVILGENLGIIDIKGKKSKFELMVEGEPALIMKEKEMTPEERDNLRAKLIRENI